MLRKPRAEGPCLQLEALGAPGGGCAGALPSGSPAYMPQALRPGKGSWPPRRPGARSLYCARGPALTAALWRYGGKSLRAALPKEVSRPGAAGRRGLSEMPLQRFHQSTVRPKAEGAGCGFARSRRAEDQSVRGVYGAGRFRPGVHLQRRRGRDGGAH